MFETDIGSLFPVDLPQTDKGRIVDLRNRVAQLEKAQLRLLDLMEKIVEMDKIRAQSFDVLYRRVELLEQAVRNG